MDSSPFSNALFECRVQMKQKLAILQHGLKGPTCSSSQESLASPEHWPCNGHQAARQINWCAFIISQGSCLCMLAGKIKQPPGKELDNDHPMNAFMAWLQTQEVSPDVAFSSNTRVCLYWSLAVQ